MEDGDEDPNQRRTNWAKPLEKRQAVTDPYEKRITVFACHGFWSCTHTKVVFVSRKFGTSCAFRKQYPRESNQSRRFGYDPRGQHTAQARAAARRPTRRSKPSREATRMPAGIFRSPAASRHPFRPFPLSLSLENDIYQRGFCYS
jgi:hypothetical protein